MRAQIAIPNAEALAAESRRWTVEIGSARAASLGAGVIWRGDGTIVTNAHVAVTGPLTIRLANGRRLDGDVVARDPVRDLAVLRVQGRLPHAQSGATTPLRPGQLVFAYGHPLGRPHTLSAGVVHAVGPVRPPIPLPNVQQRLTWVQADVPLAPGNSGGALLESSGKVVGINTMIAGGVGLAVPAAEVDRFVASAGSGVTIGVTVSHTETDAVTGLSVAAIAPGSLAGRAGLRPGDLLVAAGGQRLTWPQDLQQAIARATRDRALTVDLVRSGQWQRRHVLWA